jgi:DNA-binding MarR family transcriptional regulator
MKSTSKAAMRERARPVDPPAALKLRSKDSSVSRSAANAVLRQFRELFRVSQQHFQRIEADCGVSGSQLWALSEMARTPGIRISDLAKAMSIHVSTASNLLDKLEEQSLIARRRENGDQRVVRVYLTVTGKRTLSKAPKPAEGVIPDALGRMPDAALLRLQKDLGALLDLASVRNRKAALKPLADP